MSKMDQNALRMSANGSNGLVRIEHVEAASQLDGFVYIVSHDLRNSARALTEVPHWLREDLEAQGVAFDPDVEENVELLERHAKRLDRMLLDLLMYSRVGRMQNVEQIDLFGLIETVCEEVNLPDRVTVSCIGNLPDLIMGNKDAFVLIKNIIDNVVRHSAGQDVDLSIKGKRRNDQVTLTFTDTGPGIEQNHLQRAFRPMTTLVRRDEIEGSGMGLAIVQRITQHYNGELWAGAGPNNKGFRLRLRLRDADCDGLVQGDLGASDIDQDPNNKDPQS